MNDTFQPVIIGEVLFDLFEDGQAVLGGAPFNVAWHLYGFGLAPLLISRIGQDNYGEQIKHTMREWGMDIAGVQVDPQHATGKVTVTLQDGQPSFDICDDVAYDYIDPLQADALICKIPAPFMYHGSLAARSPQAFNRIQQLKQTAASNFVDINLRSPWWEKDRVMELMRGADWLKVNDDELCCLTGAQKSLSSMIEATRSLMESKNIGTVILTRGAQGAVIIGRDELSQSPPVRAGKLQDTVGAGDAFSAVCMLGIVHAWMPDLMLARATEFAARICEQRGATSQNHRLYAEYKQQWQLR